MFKNIAIGQYYNTNSLIHSFDPRTKIISLILLMIGIFSIHEPIEFLIAGIIVIGCVILSRVPLGYIIKGLKPIWVLIVFTAIINLLMGSGETILFQWKFIVIKEEAAYLALSMMARVVLLVSLSSLLTLTTSAMDLTTGIEKLLRPLEKIKFPAHEIAMMMSIALRFIPTLAEEAEKIMKAQRARGNDFETGGIIKKAKALIPLFVPLFISAFRRADDLAMAMECRCYKGGEGRTNFKNLKYGKKDVATLIFVFSVIGALVFWRIMGFLQG